MTRDANVALRGAVDAQRQADALSAGYYALHGAARTEEEPDPEEVAEERRAVERISSRRHLLRGLVR